MYPRFAFALLFSVCAFGLGIAIPAFPDQKCGPNAEYLGCGSACVPDCANPQPPKYCTLQCVSDCFCKEGFLKNAKGECVRPNECDRMPRLPMQKPSAFSFPTCPDNEVFQACGSACAPTCANPNPSPLCTKNCVVGCFCKEGYLRNSNGVCVLASQCEAPKTSAFFAYPPEMTQCKDNEIFMPCGSACAPTCSNPHPSPVCTRQCVVGCFCKPGYLKNDQGVCVAAETCGVSPSEAIPVQPQVCGKNEIYRQCKGCDGTCDKPNPICPRICVPGCACKPGHVRSGPNGQCMPKADCKSETVDAVIKMPPPPVHRCQSDRESYIKDCGTQMDCVATCHMPPTFLIRGVPQIPPMCQARKCAGACVCQYPYVRNTDGQCVERKDCDPITSTPAH